MNHDALLSLLGKVQSGACSPEEAADRLKLLPFEDLGYANVDHHRSLRQGQPEVIYGSGKTTEQIAGILQSMTTAGSQDILVSRLAPESAEALQRQFLLEYHPIPRLGIVNRVAGKPQTGAIVLASGGTSDMPVCEEAALTAEVFGSKVIRLYDVGVAGLHRLLSRLDILLSARVVIVVAGMEGALASVVGGLVSCPVIAVPTSVGYGSNFNGLSSLLSMLNSCASGVAVVNIDNGFGAGLLAHRINQMEGVQ